MRLPDIGVDRKLSGRAQKLRRVPERAFEAMMGRMREQPPYALISSLSRATRSCGSLVLLIRYSYSPSPGRCLITS
jgi:hypothetical protein